MGKGKKVRREKVVLSLKHMCGKMKMKMKLQFEGHLRMEC